LIRPAIAVPPESLEFEGVEMRTGWLLAAILLVCTCPAAARDPSGQPLERLIDAHLTARLAQLRIESAPPAGDTALLRRTMLDLAGRIPTADEARHYTIASDRRQREDLVDRLLASDEFARQQRDQFDLMFTGAISDGAWRDYLAAAVAENRPWDRMFRQMMLPAQDDPDAKAANYFLRSRVRELDDLTRDASRVFFGIDVSCAKCHDHPLVDDWKQDHYYGMQSFFNRTFATRDLIGEREDGIVKFKTTAGEEKQARLMFLTGLVIDEPAAAELTPEQRKAAEEKRKELERQGRLPPPPKFSRRAQLVEAALHPEHRHLFARSIVNRLWKQFFGVGLVNPVDQMHSENPPTHPELLAALADDLVAHGYDLRRLVRGLVLSDAYARTSEWELPDRPRDDLYIVAQVRPLTPQQYAMALLVATQQPVLPAMDQVAQRAQRLEEFDRRAMGLARNFEVPGDNFQVSATEALLLSNSATLERELLAPGGDRLVGQLASLADAGELAEAAFWAVLSRPPDDQERQAVADYLAQRADRRAAACQQIVWALVTSAEFRFNH
jgi:hypothetical protein